MGEVMRETFGRANLGVIAVVTLIATGCASLRPYDPGPGKRVLADVAQSAFAPGESVNVTIANLSELPLFYPDGFCTTELQRRDGNSWVTVSDPTAGCPTNHDFLDPGQTVVHGYRLPSGIAEGTYRLAIPRPMPEEATTPEPELLTPAFRVASSR
jgi:hypothetical protein